MCGCKERRAERAALREQKALAKQQAREAEQQKAALTAAAQK
jgi:hypothetical protein